MSILTWIIVGFLAGWIASIIMKSDGGIVKDIIMGIIGAFVGGLVMNFFGKTGVSGLDIYSILVSTLGAVIIIWIGRRFA